MPYTTAYIQSKGDPITDLSEDLAAEQKARTTYENLMRLAKDPEVYGPLLFLRQRESCISSVSAKRLTLSARIWTAVISIATIRLLTADQKRRREFSRPLHHKSEKKLKINGIHSVGRLAQSCGREPGRAGAGRRQGVKIYIRIPQKRNEPSAFTLLVSG